MPTLTAFVKSNTLCCPLGEIPIIEMKASDSQISQLLGLIITLPFGPTVPEYEVNAIDSTDKGATKNMRIAKVNVLTNEVTDAFNYATKAIEKIEILQKDPSKENNDNADGTVEGKRVVYKDLTFEFKLKSIFLSIFKCNRNTNSALAQFHLDRFSLYGEILTDSTLWLSCSVSDLRLDDIRTSRKESGLRTLLGKSYVSFICVLISLYYY